MSESYYELLVKKDRTAKDVVIKYGLITLTVVLALGGVFFSILLFIGAIAAGIASYFILPRTDLEYEYLFVNNEMDIDVIMSRSKRKKVRNVSIQQAEIVAPVNSHRLDHYNSGKSMKVYDYSSGNPEHRRLAVISRDGGEVSKIIIEPDDRMTQMIRNASPSKVFLD